MKFKFSPISGQHLENNNIAGDAVFYRTGCFDGREWMFNPWTGEAREPTEIAKDPQMKQYQQIAEPKQEFLPFGDDFDEPHMLRSAARVEPARAATGPVELAAMLSERGKRYGKFVDHAAVTQQLKAVMRLHGNWFNLAGDQMEALEMIQHKIGRILNGDPNYADSWDDIAGYAKLVGDRLNGVTR